MLPNAPTLSENHTLPSQNNSKLIPKEIYFIWFGSAVPKNREEPHYLDFWKNILLARKINPTYSINLYIDSSVITPEELKLMQSDCNIAGITLVDINKNAEMAKWFKYDLLKNILTKAKDENIVPYYGNASDILRMLLMIYKGGYYFDCDCDAFPSLAETENIAPPFGLWQCLDPDAMYQQCALPYCFQGSVPFNPIYILAIADIVNSYNIYGELVDGDNDSNPLLIQDNVKKANATMFLTGGAVFRAILSRLAQEGKEWSHYVNGSHNSIILPSWESISHRGAKSYAPRVNHQIKETEEASGVHKKREEAFKTLSESAATFPKDFKVYANFLCTLLPPELKTQELMNIAHLAQPLIVKKEQEGHRQLMLIAPLENPHLVKSIRGIQKTVAEEFGIKLTEADNDPLHISFATNLHLTGDELATLQKKLYEFCISTLTIELGEIKAFPGNGTIYLEIKDNGQLAKLNAMLIQTIKESGISCNIRFAFVPHVTLCFSPANQVSNEQLAQIRVSPNEKFYLTEVAVSEQNTAKGKTTYTKHMTLPGDFFIASKNMEMDYFKGEQGKKLYLSKEFDNNPLADYYRLLSKLNSYDLITCKKDHDEAAAGVVKKECLGLYKKILGFGEVNYPDNIKALILYARGLICQYPDRLTPLQVRSPAGVPVLDCYRKAFEMGYIPAAKNLGIICYELKDFANAEMYLKIATRYDLSDPHTDNCFSQYFRGKSPVVVAQIMGQEEIKDTSSDEEKCLVM